MGLLGHYILQNPCRIILPLSSRPIKELPYRYETFHIIQFWLCNLPFKIYLFLIRTKDSWVKVRSHFHNPCCQARNSPQKKFSNSSSKNPACFHLPPFMPLLTLPLCLRDVIHILSHLYNLSNSICVHLTSTVSTSSLPVARETLFPFLNLSPPFYFTLSFSLRACHFP